MATTMAVPLSPLSFLKRAGQVFPDKLAVVTATGWEQSYGDFLRGAEVLASRLRAAGLGTGSQVAFLSRNGPEALRAHYGVPGAGAALVALNIRLAPAEYKYILEDSRAAMLFVEAALLDRVEPVLNDIDCPVVVLPDADTMVAGDVDGLIDYQDWLDEAPDDQRGLQLPADEHDPITINYTSGTTGQPKGAVYTHRGAYLNAMGVALELQLSASSTYLWTLPMFHCNGWCCTWAVAAAGGSHVAQADFEPSLTLELIEEHQVSHLCGAPVVLNSIATAAQETDTRFSQSVTIATGGAPPAPASIAAMRELGVDVVHLYGLTETYGPSLICEPQPGWDELDDNGLASVLARQGVRTVNVEDVRVVDDAWATVADDGASLGEIVVRSNSVVPRYFEDPDATARAFHDGWFRTGDLAVVHPDGYIEIRDRSKDVIISGGENVSSIEVENVLISHPSVHEVAVVARPHERWGEVPVAYVTLRPGTRAEDQELIDYVRERLAHFKAPKAVVFRELPKTSTGKIKKYELREEARQG